MLTKPHRTFVTVSSLIFALTSTGCSTLPDPHSPLTFAYPGHGACYPHRFEDVQGCLYRGSPDMSELEARDRARQLVFEKNPKGEDPPPWCRGYGGLDAARRTSECAKRWEVPKIPLSEAREWNWSEGPPKPDWDPWINEDGSCRGPGRCLQSFHQHHPKLAEGIALAVVVGLGYAFIQAIKGHGSKGKAASGNPTTCFATSANNYCNNPAQSPACIAYYSESPDLQKLFGKPPGC